PGGARCSARPLARMTKGSLACREQAIDKVRGQAAPMLPPRVGELRLRASAFSNRGRASASTSVRPWREAHMPAHKRVCDVEIALVTCMRWTDARAYDVE
ncbi:MAG: hypothetical protein ACPIOQ_84410, partial [Promethearchaeia archaeon]